MRVLSTVSSVAVHKLARGLAMLAVFWLLSAGDRVRADSAEDAAERSVIRVGYTEFRPYSFTARNGEARGYVIDLIGKLLPRHRHRIVFVPVHNPATMLRHLADGDIDMTTLLAMTPDRLHAGTFSDPVGEFRSVAFVAKASRRTDLEDLNGARIAAVAGSFGLRAASRIPGVEKVAQPNQDAMLTPLLTGEIDAVIAPEETFVSRLRAAGVDRRFRVLDTPVSARSRSFMVSRGNAELLALINSGIANRLSPDTLLALHQAWFGRPSSLLDHPAARYVLTGAAILGLLLMLAAGYALTMRHRAVRSFAENSANRLLIDSLDGIDLAVVIYDRDFRAVHWNDATVANFPKLVTDLQRNARLGELVTAAYVKGTLETGKTGFDANVAAQKMETRLAAGERLRRFVRTPLGRTFEFVAFPIGEDMFASVHSDVTLLSDQAEQLRHSQEQTRRANERLSDFATIAAHDLKAPIRKIRGFLDLVVQEIGPRIDERAEARGYLDIVDRNIDAMGDLLNDLLDYARSGEQGLAECLEPDALVNSVVAMLPVPDGFEIRVESGLPHLQASRAGVETVLRNLLSNAIRHHNREEGLIHVRGSIEGGRAVLEIEDDGPGIPEGLRERIFRPFTRLDNADRSGHGFGLAFVQRAVEAWGGTISVHTGRRGGALFRLTAPLGVPESAETPQDATAGKAA